MMSLYRRFRVRWAFRSAREDLYEKLLEELGKEGAKRTETLSALFAAWAQREAKRDDWLGRSKWLAVAHASIANKMNNEGQTLSETLKNLVPFEERMVIWGGEQRGQLVPSLQHALRIKRILEEMKSNTRAALQQPAVGAFNVFITSFILGIFVWPDLLRSIPSQFWPGWAMPSISFDLWFARNWPVLGLIAPMLYLYFYTLSRWTGRTRAIADKIFPWAIYREEQANVLLTTLAGLLNNNFTIPHACEEMRIRSTPYLRWHLNRIVPQLEVLGDEALRALDTGLISRSVMDRLEDSKRNRDLAGTVQHVGDKSLAAMVRTAKRYAAVVSTIVSLFFVLLFLYSAAVQLIGTQTASDAYGHKLQRMH